MIKCKDGVIQRFHISLKNFESIKKKQDGKAWTPSGIRRIELKEGRWKTNIQ